MTFLDHHVRCGNSLIGIRSLDQLTSIPERKKSSKKKDNQSGELFPDFQEYASVLAQAGQDVRSISMIDEDKTDEQKSVFDNVQQKVSAFKALADIYTSYLMDSGIRPDDYHALFYSLAKKQKIQNPLNPDLPKILEAVDNYHARHHFFHWPLKFPDVFPNKNSSFIVHNSEFSRGFAATIGNPPWDIVKPNSQEFFSDYDSKFRSYKKQEANCVSKKLMADNPAISEKWEEYCDGFAEQSAYFKEPLSYSPLGKGDINTFKLFMEQFFSVLGNGGRMGILVPSGIYTDQGCQPLRERFFSQSKVKFLYGFENRWPTVFSAVDGRFKFITFGTQKGGETDRFKCAFMEHDPERLPVIDAHALFLNTTDIKRFSGDVLSIPEFNDLQSLKIGLKILGNNGAAMLNSIHDIELIYREFVISAIFISVKIENISDFVFRRLLGFRFAFTLARTRLITRRSGIFRTFNLLADKWIERFFFERKYYVKNVYWYGSWRYRYGWNK